MCIRDSDTEIFELIEDERARLNSGLQLIASENFTSPAVMEATGSILTNKYSEGYPGKRYYGGNQYIDTVESLAIDRVKDLFGAAHANVQPHAGANANMAVFLGLLEPGDTVMGMSLDHGGHLTHGSPVNASGKLYDFVSYEVTPSDERIDLDQLRERAHEFRPKMIIAGASAYPRIIDFETFGEIAREVGARMVVDMAHIAGLVATGHHPSPVPHSDVVTTTTHKTLRGPRGGLILCPEEHAKGIDKSVFPFMQGGPLMHVVAAKAVSFKEALEPGFSGYSAQVIANAKALGAGLAERGFHLVSGGTDNHLLLVDLRPSHDELTGKEAERALEDAGITVNKNTVPGETRSPFVTSGLRIGTPALTTRGMGESEMHTIAGWMADILAAPEDEANIASIREDVRQLCTSFPLYAEVAAAR